MAGDGLIKGVGVFFVCAALAAGAGYGLGALQTTKSAKPVAEEPLASVPATVEIGQIVVPVVAEGRTTAFILAQITLDVAPADQLERVKKSVPKARDAALRALFALAGAGAFDTRTIDPARVAQELKRGINESLDGAPVKAVLIDRLLRQDNSRA